MRLSLKHPAFALIALAGAAAAAPALAQTTVDEVTVVGRFGADGRPLTLSRVVSYADLDITTYAGQTELRRRINLTARDVCRELGESRDRTNLGKSCEEMAIRDAVEQMRVHVASAHPRDPAWALAEAPPPAYVAPVDEPDAEAASSYAEPASATAPATYTTRTITNDPVPDTPENRARYGGPMSRGGQMTAPRGN
jgi:UrcA family protein